VTENVVPQKTWAGTHIFAAPQLVNATSTEQVQELVAASDRVRALGTRHSFNDLADTTGTLVSLIDVPPEIDIDEAAQTATVTAGTRYGIVAQALNDRGWALHNMGSLPHISVGGAIATATHGSGVANGNLSTAVRGLEIVTANGELATVVTGNDGFDGMVVGLGAFGVTTKVTLAIQPAYDMRQDIFRGMPWDAFLGAVPEVMGAAYSVSIFTNWIDADIEQVWLKSLDGAAVSDELLGAVRDRESHLELIDGVSNLTEQGGVVGPWLLRLPHFRLDSTPSAGDEIQTEYFVALADAADALRAVRELAERIAPLLLITELRTVAADSLWLSTAYARDSLAIHFTWKNMPIEVWALLPDIEAALAPFGARPHWGKVNRVDAATIAQHFARLSQFRALAQQWDPAGKFRNAALERTVFADDAVTGAIDLPPAL
jgi:alditol oxidase